MSGIIVANRRKKSYYRVMNPSERGLVNGGVRTFVRVAAFAGAAFVAACSPARPHQAEGAPPTPAFRSAENQQKIAEIEELLAEMRAVYPECGGYSPKTKLEELALGVDPYNTRVVKPGTLEEAAFNKYMQRVHLPYLKRVAQDLQGRSLSEREITEQLAYAYGTLFTVAEALAMEARGSSSLSEEMAHVAGYNACSEFHLGTYSILKDLKGG